MSDDEQPREPAVSAPVGGGRAAVEAKLPTMPESMRNLRACLLCSLVKTFDQFERVGCDNCEQVLLIKHDEEKVSTCTSTNFDGLITLMQPRDSWVAKWQNVQHKVPGVYAISVVGTLPTAIIEELRTIGINYRPGQRDKTKR